MNVRKDRQWYREKIKSIKEAFTKHLIEKNRIKPHIATSKIITIYITMGFLWILLSDNVLNLLVQDTNTLIQIQTYKGWFYVAITGFIFYLIIYRKINLYKNSIDKLFEGYEELSATHEELLAMDEELRQQFQNLEIHRRALIKSEERYQLVVEGANDGIWEWDLENNTYFSSLKWKEVFGYTNEEAPKNFNDWKKILHPEDKKSVEKLLNKYLKSQSGIYENTYRLICKNGEYRWILSRAKGIWDEYGYPIRVAGSHTDITRHMELQESLHREKELYKGIVNGASVFIVGVNRNEEVFEFNPFAEELTGYEKDEVIHKKWSDLFIPEERKEHTKTIIQNILEKGIVRNQENQIITKDGKIKDILWNNNAVYDSKGNVLGFIAVGTNITNRKSMEKELFSLAFYDKLTGLPNRQKFEQVIEDKINKAKHTEGKFALLYLDLDDFKKVNDTFGHLYGDKLLKKVADKLKRMTNLECVARLSGDEFGIINPNVKNKKEFNKFILSIMDLINRFWVIDGNEFYITSSIGIAIYPDDGENFQTLLKNADTAMYTAKDNSKNTYAYYTSEMYDKALKVISMDKDLRRGLLNHEFDVYYQPIINFKNGKIVGLEALIRWIHPEKGIISPMEFIPFAEETGLIVDIGEEVILQVCNQIKKWNEMSISTINVSINLSTIQLRQHNLINRIIEISKSLGVNGQSLTFEITENVAFDDLKHSMNILNIIRNMDIKIALDDFGTGYSSLNYLNKLPIDIIKIDKGFIKDITKTSDKKYISKTIIDLAHNMNLLVTAEGVETLEQYNILKGYNCDFAQGYLFSKPLRKDDIEDLLISKTKFTY